jgi:hypothetical protein
VLKKSSINNHANSNPIELSVLLNYSVTKSINETNRDVEEKAWNFFWTFDFKSLIKSIHLITEDKAHNKSN